jgi:phage tail P2-like protein
MALDVRTASLLDFVPESIARDEEIIAISLAIDPELREVGAAIIEAVILPRIDSVPEEILDALAWGFRLNELQLWVDAAGDALRVTAKRDLLKNIFVVLKKSGTPYALRRMIDLIGVTATIIEWFEEAAAPHTYRIRIAIDQIGVTLAQLLQVPDLTHRFARASQKMSQLAVESDRLGLLRLYPAATVGRHVEIQFGGP